MDERIETARIPGFYHIKPDRTSLQMQWIVEALAGWFGLQGAPTIIDNNNAIITGNNH